MTPRQSLFVAIVSSVLSLPAAALAADLVATEVIPAPPASEQDGRGIWGAIAYSPADGRHGFFWGADKREEAEKEALRHCENAKGAQCKLVTVFRNHRHWDDDDLTGFPYYHCGALAVSGDAAQGSARWGAASAETRKEAEDLATGLCGGEASQCRIREWVCT